MPTVGVTVTTYAGHKVASSFVLATIGGIAFYLVKIILKLFAQVKYVTTVGGKYRQKI